MTNHEVEEILEKAKLAITSDKFKDAETMATQVISADLYVLPSTEQQAATLSVAYSILADSFLKRGIMQPALQNAKEALRLSIQSTNEEEQANALLLLGIVYVKLLESSKASDCFNDALVIYRKLNNRTGIANCTLYKGAIHFNDANYSTALEYYQQALEEYNLLDLKALVAFVLGNIGTVHHVQSDYFQALKYYHQALAIQQELGKMSEVSKILGNIGSAYREISDYHTALEYYEKAMTISEELGLLAIKANVIGNIGITYRNILDFPKSIEYLEKSVTLHEELSLMGGVAMYTGNIGITYLRIPDYPQAIEYFEKACQIYQELNLEVEVALFESCLGNTYYNLLEFVTALEYVQKALVIFEKVGRKVETAGAKGTIGYVYAHPNFEGYNFRKAEEYLLESITGFERLGSNFHQYEIQKQLANLYKQEKRWEEYSTHIEKHHQLYIEVQNDEVKKQADRFGWERKIADMEKQKEIEAIKTDADKHLLEETISFQKLSLEQQAREVKNTVDELVRKNSLLQLIQSDLKKIVPHTKREGTDHIDQLLERVTRNITPLESNQQLDKKLTEVHGEFISNLHQKFPDLTTMELKIAALLSMKLTSSNIAAALFLAKRTVESHRFSIRKKMGLGTSDDIYQALAQYAT